MFPRRCLDPLGSVFYVKKIVDVAQFKGYDFEIRKKCHLIQALSITALINILALNVYPCPEWRFATVYIRLLYKYGGKYLWSKESKLVALDHSRLANARCGLAITSSKSFTRNQKINLVQETSEQQAWIGNF